MNNNYLVFFYIAMMSCFFSWVHPMDDPSVYIGDDSSELFPPLSDIFTECSYEESAIGMLAVNVHTCIINGCGLQFCTKQGLKQHSVSNHDPDGYSCENCPEVRSSQYALTQHNKICHPSLVQQNVNKFFEINLGVTSKKTNMHQDIPQPMPSQAKLCGVIFSLKKNVGAKKEIFICDEVECGAQFEKKSAKLMHEKQAEHDPSLRFFCSTCFKKFSSRLALKQHKKQKKCSIQDIAIRQLAVIKAEIIKKITGKRKRSFECEVPSCRASYPQRSFLKKHLEKSFHDRKLPHKCLKCLAKFSTNTAFIQHKKTHFKIKLEDLIIVDKENHQFICKDEHCGAVFFFKYLIKKHLQRGHDSQLPNECIHCFKKFSSKGALVQHFKNEHKNTVVLRSHSKKKSHHKKSPRKKRKTHS